MRGSSQRINNTCSTDSRCDRNSASFLILHFQIHRSKNILKKLSRLKRSSKIYVGYDRTRFQKYYEKQDFDPPKCPAPWSHVCKVDYSETHRYKCSNHYCC